MQSGTGFASADRPVFRSKCQSHLLDKQRSVVFV